VAKIKFRQPLAELRVQASDEALRRAVARFPDQLREELNVKAVTLHEGNGSLLNAAARLNKRSAAAKLKGAVGEAERYLASTDPLALAAQLKSGPVEVAGVLLDAGDINIEFQAATGWAGVADRGAQVAVDARVTDELAKEGLARDVIRHVQDQRRQAELNMEDRIELYLGTDSDRLRAAIDAHRDHIAAETLTTKWATTPYGQVDEIRIEGHVLGISLRKTD
jgi:isoleucyl-tRNA synthetase